MRWIVAGLMLGCVCLPMVAEAGQREQEQVLGVVSGLLGVPPKTQEATYTAEQKERLVSLLLGGQYVTSRQGEPVDLMVYGVPLTRVEHVYAARPIPTAQQTP